MADPLELAFAQRRFELFVDKRQYFIQTFTTLQLTISFKLEKLLPQDKTSFWKEFKT